MGKNGLSRRNLEATAENSWFGLRASEALAPSRQFCRYGRGSSPGADGNHSRRAQHIHHSAFWKQSQGFRTALRLASRSLVTFSTLSVSTPTSFSASRK